MINREWRYSEWRYSKKKQPALKIFNKYIMDTDLATRLHAHEVVCRTALKLAANVPGWRSHNKVVVSSSLAVIGAQEFGLTEKENAYCLGRARNFLIEVREADKRRNKAAQPRILV